MDTIVNRWDSLIFDDEELDVLSDIVESTLFRDYLCYDNAFVTIYTQSNNEEDAHMVLLWKEATDRRYERFVRGYAMAYYMEVRDHVADYPVPQFVTNMAKFTSGHYLDMMTIKLAIGYVYCYAPASHEGILSAAHIDLFALAQAVCRVLSPRDKTAEHYAAILPTVELSGTDEDIRNDVTQMLDDYFNSGRKSVNAWKNTHC